MAGEHQIPCFLLTTKREVSLNSLYTVWPNSLQDSISCRPTGPALGIQIRPSLAFIHQLCQSPILDQSFSPAFLLKALT